MPDDAPQTWREAFARLSPTTLPCPGLRADEWYALHPLAKAFLAERADEAYEKGWRGLDLFGVHPEVGAANVNVCGALMLGPAEAATNITPESIGFGRTRFYRKEMRGSVMVWAFGA